MNLAKTMGDKGAGKEREREKGGRGWQVSNGSDLALRRLGRISI